MCRWEAEGGVWSASDFPCAGSVIEAILGCLFLCFSPLPCLASSFFSQTFMLLNASMPCLRNTPVGELIQKQGANECVDRKPKEAFGRQAIFHVPGLLLRRFWAVFSFPFLLCLPLPQASFPKHSWCSMLRCPVSGTHQLGNLYRSKEQMNVYIRRLRKDRKSVV